MWTENISLSRNGVAVAYFAAARLQAASVGASPIACGDGDQCLLEQQSSPSSDAGIVREPTESLPSDSGGSVAGMVVTDSTVSAATGWAPLGWPQ